MKLTGLTALLHSGLFFSRIQKRDRKIENIRGLLILLIPSLNDY